MLDHVLAKRVLEARVGKWQRARDVEVDVAVDDVRVEPSFEADRAAADMQLRLRGGAEVGAQPPASSLTGRSITAVGYFVDAGTTTVDLKTAGAIEEASGKAKVKNADAGFRQNDLLT